VFRKSLQAAVAVLAAGAALTACGPVKTGAAAIVGDHRITTANLNSAVTQWSKELPKYPEAQQIVQQAQGQQERVPFDPASPERSALFQLIEMRAWNEVAREQHVSIAPGQIDAFVAARGGRAGLNAYVVAEGLPTRYADDYARTLLIQQSMLRRYGVVPGQAVDQQTQQRILDRLVGDYAGAKRSLHISVNPRYGTYDDQKMTLGPVCRQLSSPDTGTPNGSPSGVKCQV
jgi:hypothetical protein